MHDDVGDKGEVRSDQPTERSDMVLLQRALRADWPIPEKVRRTVLQRAIDICDPETDVGKRAKERLVLSAMKVIALYGSLNIKQQELDLKREELDHRKGTGDKVTLADLTAEAEAAHEQFVEPVRPEVAS